MGLPEWLGVRDPSPSRVWGEGLVAKPGQESALKGIRTIRKMAVLGQERSAQVQSCPVSMGPSHWFKVPLTCLPWTGETAGVCPAALATPGWWHPAALLGQ